MAMKRRYRKTSGIWLNIICCSCRRRSHNPDIVEVLALRIATIVSLTIVGRRISHQTTSFSAIEQLGDELYKIYTIRVIGSRREEGDKASALTPWRWRCKTGRLGAGWTVPLGQGRDFMVRRPVRSGVRINSDVEDGQDREGQCRGPRWSFSSPAPATVGAWPGFRFKN